MYEVFWQKEWQEAARRNHLFLLEIETTNRCFGSCAYCFSSSDSSSATFVSRERVCGLVDEAKELGVGEIYWSGGDPMLHPHWYEFSVYATEQGIHNTMLLSLLFSKKEVNRLVELGCDVLVHIDTLDPELYARVHTNPRTLERKVRCYRELLEAGLPPERAIACITYTKAAAERIEETIDWYVDEMKVRWITFTPFKCEGFGGTHRDWEPSKDDLRRAVEYRAKKFGDENYLRFGSTDGGIAVCKAVFVAKFTGQVTICPMLYDFSVGDFYQESLMEIFEKRRDDLTFNSPVKGYCGEGCPDREVCFGCRANAYHYLGDLWASDPKCWRNPEAPDYCYPENRS
jgi:MoaA/NifB/PqqE/SkfB family radical SAM enzyme